MVPPEQLRHELADSRRRGLPFAAAWPAVVGRAAGAAEWLEAFSATEWAWRRAYDGVVASRQERACSLLLEDAELADSRPAADRTCERCEAEIPAGRHRNARYCDDACRRLANYHNERAAHGRALSTVLGEPLGSLPPRGLSP